jgi:hypothetical protein
MHAREQLLYVSEVVWEGALGRRSIVPSGKEEGRESFQVAALDGGAPERISGASG